MSSCFYNKKLRGTLKMRPGGLGFPELVPQKMKNTAKLNALQREYFHRLLSDRSVDDKMPFFIQAKRIFDLIKKKSRKKKR